MFVPRARADCGALRALQSCARRGDQRDEAWFKREIASKLDAFSLREIAAATGLSLAACSRIRAGARVPHPRHWEALRQLVDS
jgi:hypothetical protein